MNAGKILENSIVINTAEPEHDGAIAAYVVVGIARDQEDNYYVETALIDVYENCLLYTSRCV